MNSALIYKLLQSKLKRVKFYLLTPFKTYIAFRGLLDNGKGDLNTGTGVDSPEMNIVRLFSI